jgi:hypothetical protein
MGRILPSAAPPVRPLPVRIRSAPSDRRRAGSQSFMHVYGLCRCAITPVVRSHSPSCPAFAGGLLLRHCPPPGEVIPAFGIAPVHRRRAPRSRLASSLVVVPLCYLSTSSLSFEVRPFLPRRTPRSRLASFEVGPFFRRWAFLSTSRLSFDIAPLRTFDVVPPLMVGLLLGGCDPSLSFDVAPYFRRPAFPSSCPPLNEIHI